MKIVPMQNNLFKLFFLFFCLVSLNLKAQNLVDTPNIETTDSCVLCNIEVDAEMYFDEEIMYKEGPEALSDFEKTYYLDNFWDSTELDPYKNAMLSKDFSVVINLLANNSDFAIPNLSPITSRYGRRWGRAHQGIDIDLNTGDSVVAAFDGVVRLSQWYHGYGNFIIVRHFSGIETCYAHLVKRHLGVGSVVKAGDLLGFGGNTGHSTGSHLHFETRYLGISFDPERIFDFANTDLKTFYLNLNSSFFHTKKE